MKKLFLGAVFLAASMTSFSFVPNTVKNNNKKDELNNEKTNKFTLNDEDLNGTGYVPNTLESYVNNVGKGRMRIDGLGSADFIAEFPDKVRKIDFASTDALKLSEKIDQNTVDYSICVNKEISQIKLRALLNDDTIVNRDYYAYFNNKDVFVSDFSVEDAFYKLKQFELEKGIIDKEKCIDQIEQFVSRFVSSTSTPTITYDDENIEPKSSVLKAHSSGGGHQGNTSIAGRITIEEKLNGKTVIKPLVNTKIVIKDQDFGFDATLGETFTDDNGYYEFYFDNQTWFENGGVDPYLEIRTEGRSFSVRRDWLPVLADKLIALKAYSIPVDLKDLIVTIAAQLVHHFVSFADLSTYTSNTSNNVIQNIKTGAHVTNYNHHIPYDKSSEFYKAMCVSQAMSYAENFAHDYIGMPITKSQGLKAPLNVAYPLPCYVTWLADIFGKSADLTAFSFKFLEGICGIPENEWEDWNTCIHEFGHFVQNTMGVYGSDIIEIITNGPTHTTDANHFEDKKDKQYAMELTWSESWAYAFPGIAYEVYADLKDRLYADEISQNIKRMENVGSYTFTGESQERSVEHYLWDLYDDTPTEEKVNLGARVFFNETIKPGIYTLNDFMKSFDDFNNSNIDYHKNGVLLEDHNIAPKVTKIINNTSQTTAPTIEWRLGGGETYPNNIFDLSIYSDSGRLLKKISNIQAPSGTKGSQNMTYTLSMSDWKAILSNQNGEASAKVVIEGYENRKGKISGPYHSSYFNFNLPAYVQSLSLSGSYKKEFTQGDTFDYSGLVVTAKYSDGSSKTIPNGSYTVSRVNLDYTGEHYVKISYTENGKTVSTGYYVNVTTSANRFIFVPYCPCMFEYFNGHGHIFYIMTISVPAPFITPDQYDSIVFNDDEFEVLSCVPLDGVSIWYNWTQGTFDITATIADNQCAFGWIKINYTQH